MVNEAGSTGAASSAASAGSYRSPSVFDQLPAIHWYWKFETLIGLPPRSVSSVTVKLKKYRKVVALSWAGRPSTVMTPLSAVMVNSAAESRMLATSTPKPPRSGKVTSM